MSDRIPGVDIIELLKISIEKLDTYKDSYHLFTEAFLYTRDVHNTVYTTKDKITLLGKKDVLKLEKIASDIYKDKETKEYKEKVVFNIKNWNLAVECIFNENKGVIEDIYEVEATLFLTYIKPSKIIKNTGLVSFEAVDDAIAMYLDTSKSNTKFMTGLFMTVETVPDGDIKYSNFYIDYTFVLDYINNNTAILDEDRVKRQVIGFKNSDELTYTVQQDGICITLYKINSDSLMSIKEVLYLSILSNYNKLKDTNKAYDIKTV